MIMPSHLVLHDTDDLHHAGLHVVEQVAMERPVPGRVCRDVEGEFLGWFDNDGVLLWIVATIAVDHLEKHAV